MCPPRAVHRYGSTRSVLRLLLLCLPLTCLWGCALFCTETPQPSAATAVIHTGPWGKIYRGGYVEIVAVGEARPTWSHPGAVVVSPGEHTGLFHIQLCSGDQRNCVSTANASVTFRAAAGHSYRVCAREKVHGSNQFWVWVEDTADGQVAGGSRPADS